ALVLVAGCLAAQQPSRNSPHPVMDLLRPRMATVTEEQLERIKTLPFEAIWGAVQRAGYVNSHHSGLTSTRLAERLVGRALTIRYLPRRPDLVDAMQTLAKQGDWPAGWHVRAAEEVKPGDVI